MLLEFFRRTHPGGGGGRTLNRTLGLKKKIPSEICWVCLKFCSFLDFELIENVTIVFRRTHPGGGGGGAELLKELVELPTKNSANFCNFKNPVSLRVMIFAELYLRRTLALEGIAFF